MPTGAVLADKNRIQKEARHIKYTLVDVYPPLLRFFALLRSLTIPFNAIFSVVILGSVVSGRTIMCLVVVITGFVVGCGGEVKLSILGVQWGLISSVAVSLNSIYTKKVTKHCIYGVAHNARCRPLGFCWSLARSRI